MDWSGGGVGRAIWFGGYGLGITELLEGLGWNSSGLPAILLFKWLL